MTWSSPTPNARLLFADAHCHSNPVRGLGAREVARRFRAKGGWFIALVGLSPWHYNIDVRGDALAAYKRAFEVHVAECRAARDEGLRVKCFAGFHPADVDHLISWGMKPENVLKLGLEIVKHLSDLCRRGLLDGIGEVGWQHFNTSPERFAIAREVLTEALVKAEEAGCLVHLHLDNSGPITAILIDRLLKRLGVDKDRVLLHHAKPAIAHEASKLGLWSTLPGKKPLLEYALGRLKLSQRVMVESDFIDDPKRPCVSSCPWDVIDAQVKLLESGVVDEDVLQRINVDNVTKFYDVEPP